MRNIAVFLAAVACHDPTQDTTKLQDTSIDGIVCGDTVISEEEYVEPHVVLDAIATYMQPDFETVFGHVINMYDAGYVIPVGKTFEFESGEIYTTLGFCTTCSQTCPYMTRVHATEEGVVFQGDITDRKIQLIFGKIGESDVADYSVSNNEHYPLTIYQTEAYNLDSEPIQQISVTLRDNVTLGFETSQVSYAYAHSDGHTSIRSGGESMETCTPDGYPALQAMRYTLNHSYVYDEALRDGYTNDLFSYCAWDQHDNQYN
jgi:hypothetical protein